MGQNEHIKMNEGNLEIELELFILNEHNTYTIEYTVNGGLPVTTTDTKINVPNLSPGDYKIIIKAKTLNSEWEQGYRNKNTCTHTILQTTNFLCRPVVCCFCCLCCIQ